MITSINLDDDEKDVVSTDTLGGGTQKCLLFPNLDYIHWFSVVGNQKQNLLEDG